MTHLHRFFLVFLFALVGALSMASAASAVVEPPYVGEPPWDLTPPGWSQVALRLHERSLRARRVHVREPLWPDRGDLARP